MHVGQLVNSSDFQKYWQMLLITREMFCAYSSVTDETKSLMEKLYSHLFNNYSLCNWWSKIYMLIFIEEIYFYYWAEV